jgi:hypothetical protein
VLALMQQPWFEPPVEPLHALVRQDLDSYPFRQMPRFVDEVNAKVDLVQSMVSAGRMGGYGGCRCGESDALYVLVDQATSMQTCTSCR